MDKMQNTLLVYYFTNHLSFSKRISLRVVLNYSIFYLFFLFFSCQGAFESRKLISDIPFELNSSFIYSNDCKSIFYSTNRNNFFQVEQINLFNADKNFEVHEINIPIDQDIFIKDVSKDCENITFVSDTGGNQLYDVYIYNIKNKVLRNISDSPFTDDGSPQFSLDGEKLAFLSSGILKIYNLKTHKTIYSSLSRYKSFLYSNHNDEIFMEDFDSNIWKLYSTDYKLENIWNTKKRSYVPKMFHYMNENLLFISDHSGFSRIYNLDLKTMKIDTPININYDIYSPQIRFDSSIIYRMNQKGSFHNYSLMPNVETIKIDSNFSGVSYQYYEDQNLTINLYAEVNSPKTFLIKKGNDSFNVLKQNVETPSKAIEYVGEEGMSDYIFVPSQGEVRGYVLWLHGGPHTQISPRYNPFLNKLNQFSYGVICINYKGSTGVGNEFELRGIRSTESMDIQISDIKQKLDEIKNFLNIKEESIPVIGISYGAALAHRFMQDYPSEVSGIVDFSGICCSLDLNQTLPDWYENKNILFITGANDYAMNTHKKRLIEMYKEKTKVNILSFEDEGHYIRRRSSLTESVNAILDFVLEK